MTTNYTADLLTRLRNACLVKQSYTYIKFNNMNLKILQILKKEGYIKNFTYKSLFLIKVYLKYQGWWKKVSYISLIKCISKPGQRIYTSYKNILNTLKILKFSQGIAILSTSTGLKTHFAAILDRIGGELICYIE